MDYPQVLQHWEGGSEQVGGQGKGERQMKVGEGGGGEARR